MLLSPHKIIKFKRLCGFGVEESAALLKPTTKATTNVVGNKLNGYETKKQTSNDDF